LIDSGDACEYFEPEDVVVSRSGDECVVALCDQWFLTYSDEDWSKFVMDHVKSPNFESYNSMTLNGMVYTIDWLKDWACSRTQGLGTKITWDNKFVIESLSDSTIYMAYYTIAHLLQGDLNGSTPGKLGITADQLDDGVFEYVFKKGAYPEGCQIPEDKLKAMKYEFDYWYPMDLRCSGKDLIRNHLTMSLFNHAAIWEDKDMMPRGFFTNGYVMVDGEKMSKSLGNFLTVR